MDNKTREKLIIYHAAADALLNSLNASIATADHPMLRYISFRSYAESYNKLLKAVKEVICIEEYISSASMGENILGSHIAPHRRKEFTERIHANLSILKAVLESILGDRTGAILNLTDFFQANLRRAIFNKPEKEVEVQNAVEQLLIGRGLKKGIDYDRETGRVKVSIKETIPDFILQKLNLAIEVKLSKTSEKSKKIVDEINADIRGYGKEYDSILFIVYDLGTIRDEVEFKQDLEIANNVSVIVVKH